MTFNGNDAIGLFKNGTLIDIIGTYGSSANFASEVTLRRKSTVTAPKATYSSTDWDTYAVDTCGGLGNRIIQQNTTKNDINVTTYPNPNNGNFTIEFEQNKSPFLVEIYSTLGQKVFEKSNVKDNEIQVSNLSRGVYYVTVSNATYNNVKRVIVQ